MKGWRLLAYLQQKSYLPRNVLKSKIRNGKVSVNKKVIYDYTKTLSPGDIVKLDGKSV